MIGPEHTKLQQVGFFLYFTFVLCELQIIFKAVKQSAFIKYNRLTWSGKHSFGGCSCSCYLKKSLNILSGISERKRKKNIVWPFVPDTPETKHTWPTVCMAVSYCSAQGLLESLLSLIICFLGPKIKEITRQSTVSLFGQRVAQVKIKTQIWNWKGAHNYPWLQMYI